MRRWGLAMLALILVSKEARAQAVKFRWDGYGSFYASYNPDSGSHFTARSWTMAMDLFVTPRVRGFGTMEMLQWNERPLQKEDVLLTQSSLGLLYSPIREAWLWWEYKTGHKVRAGLIALPLGKNYEMQLDFYWPFPHRPMWGTEEMLMLPTSLPWSEPGIEFLGDLFGGKIQYHLGGFQGPRLVYSQPNPSTPWLYNLASWEASHFKDNNRDKAVSGKFTLHPTPNLTFGISGYQGQYTPNDFHETARFTAVDLDFSMEKKNIRIIGEYLRARYDNLDAVLQEFAEGYVQTYGQDQAVVNVAHLFDHANGFFVDVNFRLPMNPKFFVAGRYEGVRRYGYLHRLVKHADGTVETEGHDGSESRFTLSVGYRPSFHSELFLSVDSNKYLYLVWGLGF